MKAQLRRIETSEQGTFGKLYIDGNFQCCTGELPRYAGDADTENEKGTDCIPAGTYRCAVRYSNKFGGLMYEVHNVPGRDAILIHKGNYCGDKSKGYKSDVLGCIILGERFGEDGGQKIVSASKVAYDKFRALMNDEPFNLTISWENE